MRSSANPSHSPHCIAQRRGHAGGGSAGSRPGAGTERASRQPPAPAGLAARGPHPLRARRRTGGTGQTGRSDAGSRLLDPPLPLGHALTFSRSLPPSAVFWQVKVQANYLHPHAGFAKGNGGRIAGWCYCPGVGGLGTCHPHQLPARGAGETPGGQSRPRWGLGGALKKRSAPTANSVGECTS